MPLAGVNPQSRATPMAKMRATTKEPRSFLVFELFLFLCFCFLLFRFCLCRCLDILQIRDGAPSSICFIRPIDDLINSYGVSGFAAPSFKEELTIYTLTRNGVQCTTHTTPGYVGCHFIAYPRDTSIGLPDPAHPLSPLQCQSEDATRGPVHKRARK